MAKKWFFDGRNPNGQLYSKDLGGAPTLRYFWDGAKHYAQRVREDHRLNEVVEEMFVCGSSGRFSPTPNDVDILVFGKGITEEDRKRLFRLKIEEDQRIAVELQRNLPDYFAHHKGSYIDLEVNNAKKRSFIEFLFPPVYSD